MTNSTRVFHFCLAFGVAAALCARLFAQDDSDPGPDPRKRVAYFTERLKAGEAGGLRGANLENRAAAYLRLGEPEKALADLNECIAHEDGPPLSSYYLRGLARYVTGAYEKAADDFRFTYEGDDGGLIPRIGYLLARLRMGKGADEWIDKYLKRVAAEGDTEAPPSSVLTMLLGRTPPEDYLHAVEDHARSLKPDYDAAVAPEDVSKFRDERNAELRRTRRLLWAESHYYVYQYYLIQRNDVKALPFLRKAATCDEVPDTLWPVVGKDGLAQQDLKKAEAMGRN